MSVSVLGVLSDLSSIALDERDGMYIAPRAIEVMFKAVCPIPSARLAHDATALVTLDPEALGTRERAQSPSGTAYAALAADPAVCAYARSCVDVLNGRLNLGETTKEFRDQDVTVEDGELTPSLKVRRKVIGSRYRPLLDSTYAGPWRG